MKVELLSVAQLKDLVNAGQTDVLKQELMYSEYLADLANDSDNWFMLSILRNYMDLVKHYLS